MASLWTSLFTTPLAEADTEIAERIVEQRRQNDTTVNLVASESYCPRATLEAEASVLVNKNASGYPPRDSFGGGAIMDAVERLAASRACQLFGAEHANVQSLSSTVANVAVLRALLKPGDRLMGFDQSAGGHSSHGSRRHVSGQDYQWQSFGVGADGLIDYAAAERVAAEFRPRMIVAGSSAYPLRIDFERLAVVAKSVDALLLADIAHVAGLVVAGLHPNPVASADVVTTSTHKTLCGPRTGGLILCKQQYAAAIDAAVAPGLQAAPGGHIIAARAVLFDIVTRPPFRALMQGVVENAAELASGLLAGGASLYAGGTNTHMVVVDLREQDWHESQLNRFLLDHGIVANTTGLPRIAGKAGVLGLRVGSTPMTIRGADATTHRTIGRIVAGLLSGGAPGRPDKAVARAVAALAEKHPIPFQ
jgi:glycine hydroxymethyltransferase